jgi:cysteine synthase
MKIVERRPSAGSSRTDVSNVTDLREVMPGVLAKFECNNPAGSHKVRAARYIVESAIKAGDIVPGKTTVIEKTGGNFGFGLAVACHPLGVDVELAVGLSFSQVKRRCLELFGAHLIGVDMLHQGSTPRHVVEWHIEHAAQLGRSYFYTDQFHNQAGVTAHEFETGPEIVFQLAAWPQVRKLTFVACAGTGASLTGIARALISAGYEVHTVLVEPAGCDSRSGVFVDHRLEGMSVGVAPPFLDWSLIHETRNVTYEDAIAAQQAFVKRTGFFIGNTTAACLAVAGTLAAALPAHHKVLTIMYDHGLWYVSGAPAPPDSST